MSQREGAPPEESRSSAPPRHLEPELGASGDPALREAILAQELAHVVQHLNAVGGGRDELIPGGGARVSVPVTCGLTPTIFGRPQTP